MLRHSMLRITLLMLQIWCPRETAIINQMPGMF
jgi:hypothetical protein